MRQCIQQYGSLVWSIALRASANEAEAEATTQAIFLELWKQAGRYDPSVASESAYITMIARRCVIERLRNAVPRPPRQPAPDSLAAGEQQTAAERCIEASIAAGVLASLDPRQRRAVSLAIGQAMTYAEVAELADMTSKSAKSLLRRALIAVRKRLQARAPQGDAS